MKEITTSGLPIFLNEANNHLEFRDGLTCASDGGKFAGQMTGLLMKEEGLDPQEHCYDFYRDIVFESDRQLYQKYDFRYDITAIMPGTINGECKKTSGHYHGYISGQTYSYPEVYEVLHGECIYILQRVLNFDKSEEPHIEDLIAVRVKAGQAIIIPPFYGHCSVNIGDDVLLFSNIAVVSCPLHYGPIKDKHGLAVYVTKENGEVLLVANPRYSDALNPRLVTPKDCPALGITFGKSVYKSFVENPEKFDFLLNPENYMKQMSEMLDIR